METVEEIQRALGRLTLGDRLAIGRWLQELDRAGAKGYGVAEPVAKYSVPDPPFMTLEDFFKFEEHSKIRHEYVDGAVFAMSGASVAHERIRHRLVMAFGNHLIGGPCQVFSSGMQLVIRREASEICWSIVAATRGAAISYAALHWFSRFCRPRHNSPIGGKNCRTIG